MIIDTFKSIWETIMQIWTTLPFHTQWNLFYVVWASWTPGPASYEKYSLQGSEPYIGSERKVYVQNQHLTSSAVGHISLMAVYDGVNPLTKRCINISFKILYHIHNTYCIIYINHSKNTAISTNATSKALMATRHFDWINRPSMKPHLSLDIVIKRRCDKM